ncbi:hypothetical protein AQUCO_02200025v1 [Aquilegia coerulea]|uniref:Uncharacterized protein n=1 Tax=Aquilegia coerulea TaxID=218851 RepID=A0A2G5DDN1_AQUCA|nr:hypothetical protein AQUCO_02200025v1 [Aquilegia coerulea]
MRHPRNPHMELAHEIEAQLWRCMQQGMRQFCVIKSRRDTIQNLFQYDFRPQKTSPNSIALRLPHLIDHAINGPKPYFHTSRSSF